MNKQITIPRIITFALTALLVTNLSAMDRKRQRDEGSRDENPALLKRASAAAANESSSVATQTDDETLDQSTQDFFKILMLDHPSNILHIAAEAGHIPFMRRILDHRCLYNERGVDVRNGFNATPLHLTCELGHTDATNFLLMQEASIDPKNDYGETPLHYAVLGGYPDIVHLLLEQGADPMLPLRDDSTPLENTGNDIIWAMLSNAINKRTATLALSLEEVSSHPDPTKISALFIPREIINLILETTH